MTDESVMPCLAYPHFINFYKYLTIFFQYPGNQIDVRVYINENETPLSPNSSFTLSAFKLLKNLTLRGNMHPNMTKASKDGIYAGVSYIQKIFKHRKCLLC